MYFHNYEFESKINFCEFEIISGSKETAYAVLYNEDLQY